MTAFIRPKFKSLSPYTPGEQPKEQDFIKLNTNESPFPPSEKAVQYASRAAEKLALYPDPTYKELTEKVAETLGVSPDEVLLTNGSDEILLFATMAYCDADTPAVFPDITYGFYKVFANLVGVKTKILPLCADFSIRPQDYYNVGGTIFLANPNAPTGQRLGIQEIEEIVKQNPDNMVIVDEAYVDFGNDSAIGLIHKYENVLVTQTFSKSRSMAGARLGFGVGCKARILELNTIKYATNPYNVNRMTAAAAMGVLEDAAYTENNCREIIKTREWTESALLSLGFELRPSYTNFVFAMHPKIDGGTLYRNLKEKGILVRHFDAERIRDYNRITIGSREQMEILCRTIKEILEELQ